jgi:hypothetical protein
VTFQLRQLRQISRTILPMLLLSAPASAITMKAVITGTISNSEDQTNLFGHGVSSSLDGLSYTLTFIFEPATAGANRTPSFQSDTVYGGSIYKNTSPQISTIMEIDGTAAQLLTGDDGGGAYQNSYFKNGKTQTYYQTFTKSDAKSDYSNDIVYNYGYGPSTIIPTNLETSFSLSLLANSYGYFQFIHYDKNRHLYTKYATGYLHPKHLTVSRIPILPTPLPSAATCNKNGSGSCTTPL